MLNVRDTFRFNLEHETHLWIVICISSAEPRQLAAVNFTTKTSMEEDHCLLKVGDHKFVTHETSVRYSGIVCNAKEIEKRIKDNQIIVQEFPPVSASLLQRILEGAAKSKRMTLKLKDLLQREGLIP